MFYYFFVPKTSVTYSLHGTTRKAIREEVAKLFAVENPGTGTKLLTSNYIYIVESFQGLTIEIRRPAFLNKGFDFTVHIPQIVFGGPNTKKHDKPSHYDITQNLSLLISNPVAFPIVKQLLNNIYLCKPSIVPTSLPMLEDFNGYSYNSGILILAAKWLFIEQDITYWNYSGREMLYNHLKQAGLV